MIIFFRHSRCYMSPRRLEGNAKLKAEKFLNESYRSHQSLSGLQLQNTQSSQQLL